MPLQKRGNKKFGQMLTLKDKKKKKKKNET